MVEVAGKALRGDQEDELEYYYRDIERAVAKMKSGFSHLCFVQGRPGIGKSFQIRRLLRKHGLPYVEIGGEVSQAYLFRVLYEHNGQVIWFKDVARLLRGLRSIDLLKNACEMNGAREIMNMNYSEQQGDLPKSFAFTGKIIFDFNSLVGVKFQQDLEALFSRGDCIELLFSHNDVCKMMMTLCRTENERAVTRFLIDNYSYCGANALNLRTQRRCLNTFQYAALRKLDWREEIRQELRTQRSDTYKHLFPVLGDGPVRSLQVKKYLIRSGIVATVRTADRRIADWLALGEVYRVSSEDRNFLLSLSPVEVTRTGTEAEAQQTGSDTGDTWPEGISDPPVPHPDAAHNLSM